MKRLRIGRSGYRVSGIGCRVNPDRIKRKTGTDSSERVFERDVSVPAFCGSGAYETGLFSHLVPKLNLGTKQSNALKTITFPSTTWERVKSEEPGGRGSCRAVRQNIPICHCEESPTKQSRSQASLYDTGVTFKGVSLRIASFFLAIVLLIMPGIYAENYNGNNASLNLTTTDLSSSAAQSNGAGGRLLSAGTPGAGVVSINSAGAKAIIEPLSALAGMGVPSADFSADPLTGAAPLEVQFTDLSNPGLYTIQSWSWDFGDDSTDSSDWNPKHTYEDPGSYTVILTVTIANDALSKTRTDYIVVANGVPAARGAGLLVLMAALAAAGATAARRPIKVKV